MSHPMNEHRAHKVEKDRVSHIAGKSAGGPKCYARGGGVHGDEAEDKALIKKSVKKGCMRADGGAVQVRADKAVRRAKGGPVKSKGATTVNVIVAPGGGKSPMDGMPPAGAAPPMPPKPPMAPPPAPAAPPGIAGMGGMPPGAPPIRSDGGRAYARGGPVSLADKKGVTGIGDRTPIQHSGNKSDSQNIGRGPVITRASGGNVPTSGGRSRFEALERVGKGYQPPPPKPIIPERASGGPVSSEGLMNATAGRHKPKGAALFSDKGPMGPKMPSGSGSGPGRKFLAHQYNPKGHEPWNKDYKT